MPSTTSASIDTAVMVGLALGLSLGFTALILWGMGYLTGWRKLAAQFPAQPPAAGAVAAFGSVGFNTLGNYNNCVRFKMDEEYLHLRLMAPFNCTHPAMSIPWAVIEILPNKPIWGMHPVRIAGVPGRLPKKVVQREMDLRRELEELKNSAAAT